MKLKYPFAQDVRLLFLYTYACSECGRSGEGLELHHIFGRVSDSPFNAIPLCKICHGKVGHTLQEHARYSQWTINYLHEEGYRITSKDEGFLSETVLPTIIKQNEIDAYR